MAAERSPLRTAVGTVTSDKMNKTIAVRLDRIVKHARYGKFRSRSTTVKAHDESGQAHLGDEVEIAFARRLSKTKNWRLVRVIRKGRAEAVRGEEDREAVATRPVTRPPAPVKQVPGAKQEPGAKEVRS